MDEHRGQGEPENGACEEAEDGFPAGVERSPDEIAAERLLLLPLNRSGQGIHDLPDMRQGQVTGDGPRERWVVDRFPAGLIVKPPGIATQQLGALPDDEDADQEDQGDECAPGNPPNGLEPGGR